MRYLSTLAMQTKLNYCNAEKQQPQRHDIKYQILDCINKILAFQFKKKTRLFLLPATQKRRQSISLNHT